MWTVNSLRFVIILILIPGATQSQRLSKRGPDMAMSPLAAAFEGNADNSPDDPGFALYKAGYELILDGEWEEARKKFGEMLGKFPTSEFNDDASYWSAYALKSGEHLEIALKAYNDFLKHFPTSSYFDDAVADLSEAESQLQIEQFSETPETPVPAIAPHPPAFLADQIRMRELDRQMQAIAWAANPGSKGADPETQLRIDALNALGEGKEDEATFNTLRDVALNVQDPLPLREQAVSILSGFRKFDAMPIFVEIAKKDTTPLMRDVALDYITGMDKARSVDVLVEIFHSIPKNDKDQTSRVFYAIAEVGNDRAVDFLSTVANTHPDHSLRREAVYYLGAIGSEKARKSLQGILRGR